MARHNNGLRDFKKRIDSIPKKVRQAVQPALDQGAEEIVRTQKSLAPVDDGDVQASIRWERDGELSRKIEAGGEATTRNGYDYALAAEFGTQKMSGTNFFFGGYRLSRKRVNARVKRTISKAVKEAYQNGR